MAILENFGLTDLTEAFKKPGGVHQAWNLISLEPGLRSKSSPSDLWFKPIARCVFRNLSAMLTDHVYSQTAINFAYSTRQMRDISTATSQDLDLVLKVPLWSSSSLPTPHLGSLLPPPRVFPRSSVHRRALVAPPWAIGGQVHPKSNLLGLAVIPLCPDPMIGRITQDESS